MPRAGSLDDFAQWWDNLQQSFFDPIGRLIVRYGWFEHTIDTLIRDLEVFDGNRSSEVVLASLGGSARKLSILEEVLNVQLPDENSRDQLKSLIKRANDVRAFRNKVVHGPMTAFYPLDGKTMVQKTWINQSNYKRQFINFSPEDVLQAINEIGAISVGLNEVMRLRTFDEP